ncbi:MAG: class I SAM-dependent methyltransferase, partial [bacterium]|nr:class I SAM-dependent methyltransferase [bacterium]
MTNVKPNELNYNNYTTDKYDQDIVNSIPFHKDIHLKIVEFIKNNFKEEEKYSIIDLGVGTGITTKIIQDILPNSNLDVVDFSDQMMTGAKKKLGEK